MIQTSKKGTFQVLIICGITSNTDLDTGTSQRRKQLSNSSEGAMARHGSSTTKRRVEFQTRLLFSPRRDYRILRRPAETSTPCPPSAPCYLKSWLRGCRRDGEHFAFSLVLSAPRARGYPA